jgi:hypothetical protein
VRTAESADASGENGVQRPRRDEAGGEGGGEEGEARVEAQVPNSGRQVVEVEVEVEADGGGGPRVAGWLVAPVASWEYWAQGSSVWGGDGKE